MGDEKSPSPPPKLTRKVSADVIKEIKESPIKSFPIDPAAEAAAPDDHVPPPRSAVSLTPTPSTSTVQPSPPTPQRQIVFPSPTKVSPSSSSSSSNRPSTATKTPNKTDGSKPPSGASRKSIPMLPARPQRQQTKPAPPPTDTSITHTAALPVSSSAQQSHQQPMSEQQQGQHQQPIPGLETGSNAQQMLQYQAQQWAAALSSAAARGQPLPGLPGNGASSEEIATAIENAVLKKLTTNSIPQGGGASAAAALLQNMPGSGVPGQAGFNPMAFPSSQAAHGGNAACNKPGCGHDHSVTDDGWFDDEDDSQSWLVLYRGAYLDKIDGYLPPIMTSFIALLFWAGILNFWAAFFLVPVIVVASLHYILVKAAGMKPHKIPQSRFPCGLVSSLEAWATLTFIVSMAPMLRDLWLQCGIMLGLSAVAFYLHYKCIRSDPGALPTPNEPVNLPEQQRLMLQQVNPAWCWTCNIYKPIRSKHCSICNRCFEEFDHHCPVISNCVAKGNKRAFFIYLATLFLAEVFWLKLAVIFHKRMLQMYILQSSSAAHALPSTVSVILHVFSLGRLMPGTTYMTLLAVMICSGTGYLLARQAFITAGNLSTNECLLRKYRYDYLHAADGTFYNPFDVGPLENCVQFWMDDNIDWYKIYTARQQLDPETAIPAWSVSSLLRSRDRAVIALKAAREAKQRRREEWLLQTYGTAPPRGHTNNQHQEQHQVQSEGQPLMMNGNSNKV